MKIKTILVPLDGSQNSLRSLRQALDLAVQLGPSVIGLHVITEMSGFAAAHALVIGEPKWPSHVKDIMREAMRTAEKTPVPYQQVVIGGMVAGYDIVTFAEGRRNAVDLIVMARRGSILPKEAFPGSTTNFVIHKSKVPVLLVR